MRKHWVRLRTLPLLVSWLLIPAALATAAEPPTGSLEGVVRTSDGLALPGVAVTLDGPAGERRVTTGPDGSFRASGLAAGEYAASVDAPGLELRSPATATVGAGESRTRPRPRPGARLRARGRERHARRGHAVVARRLRRRARPPAHRRPCRAVAAAAPPGGARASPPPAPGRRASRAPCSSAGASRATRCVLVDGVAVNQPGGSFDFGTVLPFELERVEVVRGAASSLYGNDALAGVVSLQTRRARPGERPSLRAEGEGGSFDWQRGLVRHVGGARPLRLERGRAAAHHRQRGAEQPLRADGGRALRRGEDRLAHGRARGRPLRRQHDGDAGADRVRPARSRRVLRARGPRRLRRRCAAPSPASRSS